MTDTTTEVQIHPTAIVHPDAELGAGCSIGPYTIVEPNVTIGAGTQIASSALIGAHTRIGAECRIYHGAVVGSIPQDQKFIGEQSTLEIGDRTSIREFTTLNRGTSALGKTVIGSDTLVMAYVHVAHDCVIGNRVILANGTQLGGHVEIEDFAITGGLVAVHQFVRIGRNAFISGGGMVTKDICPYVKYGHDPLKPVSLNTIGLKRCGFSEEAIRTLKRAYRLLHRSSLNISQAVIAVTAEVEQTDEVKYLLAFIEESAQRSKRYGRGLTS
ncbi:MAG: acyl-ACP--UDP-N-acetylglucosamine O-acyltransferase [Gemmatimonadetes bacterium]|nr:acyl-ACP--UDP-N-acetylglucosamine O-acyltransferase [Gemmatimonadota bacterium]